MAGRTALPQTHKPALNIGYRRPRVGNLSAHITPTACSDLRPSISITIPALVTTFAFGVAGAALTVGLGVFMMVDNRRRDAREGVRRRALDVSTEKRREGPKAPEFRWFL